MIVPVSWLLQNHGDLLDRVQVVNPQLGFYRVVASHGWRLHKMQHRSRSSDDDVPNLGMRYIDKEVSMAPDSVINAQTIAKRSQNCLLSAEHHETRRHVFQPRDKHLDR